MRSSWRGGFRTLRMPRSVGLMLQNSCPILGITDRRVYYMFLVPGVVEQNRGRLAAEPRVTRLMVSAPSRMIDLPPPTDPVNEILATSGLRTSPRRPHCRAP